MPINLKSETNVRSTYCVRCLLCLPNPLAEWIRALRFSPSHRFFVFIHILLFWQNSGNSIEAWINTHARSNKLHIREYVSTTSMCDAWFLLCLLPMNLFFRCLLHFILLSYTIVHIQTVWLSILLLFIIFHSEFHSLKFPFSLSLSVSSISAGFPIPHYHGRLFVCTCFVNFFYPNLRQHQ